MSAKSVTTCPECASDQLAGKRKNDERSSIMGLDEAPGAQQFSSIMTHYFRVAWSEPGSHWDWENSDEIADAVQGFAQSISEFVSGEVARQVREAIKELGITSDAMAAAIGRPAAADRTNDERD